MITDVTARETSEKALKDSEERFRTISHHAPIGITLFSDSNTVEYINPAQLEMFGYDIADYLDRAAWYERAYPDPIYREQVYKAWQKAISLGSDRAPHVVVNIRCKDGSYKTAAFTSAPLQSGKVLVMCQDVTERARAEKALKDSEERFSLAVEGAQLATWDWNLIINEISHNDRWAELRNYSPGEFRLTYDFWAAHIHVEDIRRVADTIEQHLTGKTKMFRAEYRILTKDGKIKWVADRGRVVERDAAGNPARMTGVNIEITEQKRAAEALEESEKKYRALIEATRTGYLICDLEGRVIDANHEYLRLTGRQSFDDIFNHSFLEWTAPYHLERNRAELAKASAGADVFNFEVDYISPEGVITPIEVNAKIIETADGPRIQTLCRDISRRRKTQAALQRSERLFRSYFEMSAVGIAIVSPDMHWLEANDTFCDMVGYSRDELKKTKWNDITPPEDLDTAKMDNYARFIENNTASSTFEKRYRRKDGSLIDVMVSAKCIRHPDGTPDFLIAVIQDISEKKAAEERLRDNEERLSLAIDASEQGLWDIDLETGKTHLNNTFYTSLGYEPGAFPATRENIWRLIHPDDVEGMKQKHMNPSLNTSPGTEMLFRMKGASGEWRWILGKGKISSFSPEGKPLRVVGTISDVTQRKLLQEETVRAARLASIGELAAGVAHEINNPVNSIINCAQLLLDDAGEDSKTGKISCMVIDAGERIASIVRNLLEFARSQDNPPESSDLSSIVRDSLALFESQRRRDNINITLDIPADMPPVNVRPRQIQQVFLNLISNARYALNEKYPANNENKKLYITARIAELPGTAPGSLISISFRDTGAGMSKLVLDKITTPFFTTKPPDKGTGLGLSVSLGIVNDHGGRMAFDSIEGEYSEITLYLPAAGHSDR